MSCYSLQNLVSDFHSFISEKQAQQPDARSRFLSKCGRYYEVHSSKKACLNSDQYFQKAKNLNAFFGHAPGSMERLTPSKNLYIQCWKELRIGLKNPACSETELHQRVFNFVITHKNFALRFANEVKTNLKGTPESAELNNVETLPLLYQTVMRIICECPEKLEEIRSLLEEFEPNLFDFIPYQTILSLISNPQQPLPSEKNAEKENRAELILPIIEKIKEWRKSYEKLSETDRMTLTRAKASFLEQDKKSEEDLLSKPSPEGEKLFLESCAGIYQCIDKETVSFSALTSRLFSFILADCTQACNLTKMESFEQYPHNFSAEEALQLLKRLPLEDYANLRCAARFSFLPDNQADLDKDHCSHWNFYRIHSILMLAAAMKKTVIAG